MFTRKKNCIITSSTSVLFHSFEALDFVFEKANPFSAVDIASSLERSGIRGLRRISGLAHSFLVVNYYTCDRMITEYLSNAWVEPAHKKSG